MARKDDDSFSPFLQTVKLEQSKYDEDKAESAFFGIVDNEDEEQKNQSAVLSPNSLVNMALSLELEETDKSAKRSRKGHQMHMPMHIPPHWENYPLVIDGAISDALTFANIGVEKKERMAVALKAVLVSNSTLTASKDTYQVPYTTLQTYFHRIRHSLCFVLGDSGLPTSSARIITTKITYSQLLEQLTHGPEAISKERRGFKIFRDDNNETNKENEYPSEGATPETSGREQGNRRFAKPKQIINTPTSSIQLRTRKNAESKQIPYSADEIPLSSKRSRKSNEQTVNEPTVPYSFVQQPKNSPETLMHCHKIFELIKTGKFIATVAAIDKHFPNLLEMQKELALLLKSNKLVEIARKLQLQCESKNANNFPSNMTDKLETQSRMFLEIGHISSDVMETIKIEAAKKDIAEQSLQEAEKRVNLAFSILLQKNKPDSDDFELHQLEQLVEYFRMLLIMLKIVPMSFSLFKK